MKKRILALLLAIVMAVGVLPFGVLAEQVPEISVSADGEVCSSYYLGSFEQHHVYKATVPVQAEISFTGSGENSVFACMDLDGTFCKEDVAATLVLNETDLSAFAMTDVHKTRLNKFGIDFTEGDWFCVVLRENEGPWVYVLLQKLDQPQAAPAALAYKNRSGGGSTDAVTVYMTVSKENNFYSLGGTTMALEKITVPYFDLSLYFENPHYYNPTVYTDGAFQLTQGGTNGTRESAAGIVTVLHAFIYVAEVYYNNLPKEQAGQGWLATHGWKGFTYNLYGAGPGASYNSYWGSDFGSDATYWVNYEYPIGVRGFVDPNFGEIDVGATSDQIALHDGDIITNRYDNNMYDEETWKKIDGEFYYFKDNTSIVSEATVTQGESITLYAYKNESQWGSTTASEAPDASIYVTANSAPATHTGSGVAKTDSDGKFTLDTSNLTPGKYYVTSNTRSPAAMILHVEAAEVEEPDVILNQSAVTLTVGDMESLNAGDVEVTWSSSDPAVASVDSTGTVTALKAGTATITATATAGTKSASCTVTVEPIPVAFGDFDGDGSITMGDVTDAFNAYMNEDELTAQQAQAADVDSNGVISMGEVTAVFNAYMDA